MGIFSIVISCLIIGGVLLFEVFRPKVNKIDYLTGINIIFILVYGISPIYIYNFSEYINSDPVMFNDTLRPEFLYTSLLVLLFYITTTLTYYFTGRLSFTHKIKEFSRKIFSDQHNDVYFKVALTVFILGGVSLLTYIYILGGYSEFIRLGPLLRSSGSYFEHPLMFLKNIAPFIGIAAYLFFGLIKQTKKKMKLICVLLFLISFYGGILISFHSSGRMTMLTFLVILPLAYVIHLNRIKLKYLTFGFFLFICIVLFGDNIMNVNDQTNSLEIEGINEMAGSLVKEFVFPFTNLANAIIIYPSIYDFRGGIPDILRGFNEILPTRLIDFEIFKGENATDFNTKYFNNRGTLPVDVTTFGYMSFGTAGIMLMATFFGFITRLVEGLFTHRKNFIASIFYAGFLVFFSFRVVYGEPGHAYISSFKYIVPLILIILFVKIKKMNASNV